MMIRVTAGNHGLLNGQFVIMVPAATIRIGMEETAAELALRMLRLVDIKALECTAVVCKV